MAAATYTPSNIPLNHFIYIIQENITFDHYFGTFPGADGIPADVKLAYRPGEPPTLAPFHLHQTSIPRDLNHSWQAAHVAADGGKMDGFLWAEWPQALAFYWKGTLPTPDPEDIMPVNLSSKQGEAGVFRARRFHHRFDATHDKAAVAGQLPTVHPAYPPDGQLPTG